MSTLDTERPGHARLVSLRFAARQKLAALQHRLATVDSINNPRAHAALQLVVDEAARRLAEIEGELSGEPIEAQRDDGEIETTEEARDAMRQRLRHLLLTIESRAPESCEDAVSRLRIAVNRELKRLDGIDLGPEPRRRRARQRQTHEG